MMARRLFLVGIVLSVAACGGDASSDDPRSTAELGTGHAVLDPIDAEALAERSLAALEVSVVDVMSSRANTKDGGFPTIDPSGGPNQLKGLFALTDVVVRVESVLKDVGVSAVRLAPGDLLTITVHGGTIEVTLSPEQAVVLGLVDAPDGPPGTFPEGVGPERPVEEVEVVPTGPVPVTVGIRPSESLAEGDRLIVFLTRSTSSVYGSSDQIAIITVTHPYGIFRLAADGSWRSDRDVLGPVDVFDLADQITK